MEAQERTVFRCTVCDWYYLSEEGLWNHVQLHEIPDEKRKSHCEELITSSVLYECEQCNDQRLYEEDGYNQHIIEYHDEPPIEQVSIKCECTDCGDIFANHDLLLQHVEEAHRIIACRICAATFNDDKELDNHKITHHLEKCYSCPYCLETIPDVNTYKNHADLCSKQQYSCEICNTEFASLIFLEKHNRQVHPEDIRQSEDVVADNNDGEIIIDNIVPAHDEIKMEISVEEPTLQPVSHDQAHDDMLLVVSDVHEELHADNSSITDKEPHVTIDKKEYRRYNVGNRTVFECLICNATFDKFNAYRWHKIKTHIGKTLICPHCGKSLWKLNDFQNHIAKCAIKKFPCEFCNRRFPTKEAVEVHIKERHKLQVQQMIGLPMVTMPNVDCKCECTVCGDISENRELHFGHMKANHGHKVMCDYCTLTFTDDDELASHTKSDHNQASQKCYECTLCGIMFSSQQRYNMHKQVIHQRIQHKCSKCLQQFYKTHTFLEHKAQCVGRILSCKFCDAKFSTDKALRKHLQRNHKVVEQASEPNIIQSIKSECPICGEVFSDGFQLSKHVQESHQKTVCTICYKTFDNDAELFSHKLTTHPDPASDAFQCPHCAKHFRSSALLESHQESCGPRCLRECNICHKKYVKLSRLIEHTSSCHPEMIFSCRFCPRKFIEEAALLRHADYCAERIYSCSQCDASRKTLDEFKRHVALTGHAAEPVIAPEAPAHNEPNHQCTKCNKAFHSKSKLAKHLLRHNRSKKSPVKPKPIPKKHPMKRKESKTSFPCSLCDAVFPNVSSLKYHKRMIHQKPNIKCPDCDRTFHFKSQLESHSSVHIGVNVTRVENTQSAESDSPSYPCPHCTKQFDRSDLLKRHVRECVPHECYICNQTFTAYAKYSTHMLTNHPKLVHSCPFCPRKFFDEDFFHRHTGYCATRKYSCCECDATRMTSGEFRRHVARTGHADTPVIDCGEARRELQLPCPICKAVFRSISSQQYHMTIAHKEPHIKCPKCDEVFHFQRRMQNHLASHDGTPVDKKMERKRPKVMRWEYPCQKCSAVFYTNKELMHHKFTMHKPPSRKCSKCPECSKVFDRKSRLTDHMSRHHGGEPRKLPPNKRSCNDCNVEFNSIGAFKYHMAKIHGEHRFNCPVCSKAFHLKAKMLLHLRTHEKNNLKLIIIPADVPFPTCGAEVKPMQAEGLLEVRTNKPKTPENRSCTYCNIEFNTIAKWKYHMLKFHREPRFKCPICAKTFHYKHSGKAHLNKHGTTELEKIQLEEIIPKPRRLPKAKIEPRFKCPKCEKPFYFQSKLDRHLRNHVKFDRKQNGLTTTIPTEPRFKCPKCEKPCKFKSELKRHLESHAKQELKPKIQKRPLPAEKQSCTKCNVEFNSYGAWYYHLTHFHREFRFKCPLCMKGFQYESYLKTHLRNHEKNKQKKEPEEIIPADVPSPISDNEIEPTEAESLYASA
ncbi:zinc finger protein 91 isoform X3 [Aedes aegypti]|uniref:C2H2-type domain-containing protein n=1 Tax=Aedes aegypti TaxID=7159 RepID=A0A6I8TIZ4_AEDAE|nr:zinc finger protein 91 isoform X3 [Aedes aegypti]